MRPLRWIVIAAAAVIAMSACSSSGNEVLDEDPGTDGSAPAGATRAPAGPTRPL